MTEVRVGQPLPHELAAAEVLDRDGRAIPVGELVRGRVTLLVFLRHFGCVGCGEQVAVLAPRLLDLQELGVTTVFCGNGTPANIEGFVERHRLADKRVTVVTDPTRQAFRAAGLRRSFASTFGIRAILGELRAFGAGYRSFEREGDPLQQGGTLLVDRDGFVRFYLPNRAPVDHADPCDIVDAAARVALGGASLVERGIV